MEPRGVKEARKGTMTPLPRYVHKSEREKYPAKKRGRT